MAGLPTPISVLETYFDRELILKDMSFWNEVSDDTWVDFAKTYLAVMKAGFTAQAIADHTEKEKIRLYFDQRFGEDYDREIAKRYTKTTPLLGHSAYPSVDADYNGEGLSEAIAPLKKHLLAADELYLSDSFYHCFASVADTYSRKTWRDDPNVKYGVQLSIATILRWLPILAGLRDLITSGAINFLPHYVIPSAPFSSGNSFMTQQIKRLDFPPDPGIKPAGAATFDLAQWREQPNIPSISTEPRLNCEGALYAWLNARFLGLDPVFANQKTWQWASGIKFREETKADLTTDLMSIDILPLGEQKGLSIQDIVSMRKGEEVFRHIRDTLIGCKDYVHRNVREDAPREFVSKTCREYIRDHLNPAERLKSIKFLDNNLFAGTAVSVAVGAVFMLSNPLVGLLVPAALTPKALLAVDAKVSPKMRAAARLEALL